VALAADATRLQAARRAATGFARAHQGAARRTAEAVEALMSR
jgi:hypothetical protein